MPDGIELVCSDPTLPTGPENLAYRAAELFQRQVAPDDPPLRLTLTKHVPHGAGLGGGSSDAATVLLALNRLTERNLPLARLTALAAELGSDVPFFLHGARRSAGTGRERAARGLHRAPPVVVAEATFPRPDALGVQAVA